MAGGNTRSQNGKRNQFGASSIWWLFLRRALNYFCILRLAIFVHGRRNILLFIVREYTDYTQLS